MSQVAVCPTCGNNSKIKEVNGEVVFQSIQDEELVKKISQLKNAMEKFKSKAEALEKELEAFKSNK